MRRLRDMLVDGLLIAVPLIVLAYILINVVKLIAKLSAPVARLLPDVHWLGVAMIDVFAIFILLLLLVVIGALFRSTLGARCRDWLEHAILRKIPGFIFFKSIARSFADAKDSGDFTPVLVRFDDNTVLGFATSASISTLESVPVFVPSAPTPAAGSLFLVARERITRLNVPMSAAMGTVSRLGVGMAELITNAERK